MNGCGVRLPNGSPTSAAGRLGNLLDVQDEVPIRAFARLLDIHGPIVKLHFFGRERIIVGSQELAEEVCDVTAADAIA